jgi:tight adherence protein B
VAAFDTDTGLAVLAGGAAICLVAYRLMLRIARLPEESRVLR